jgi:hypothetical protein
MTTTFFKAFQLFLSRIVALDNGCLLCLMLQSHRLNFDGDAYAKHGSSKDKFCGGSKGMSNLCFRLKWPELLDRQNLGKTAGLGTQALLALTDVAAADPSFNTTRGAAEYWNGRKYRGKRGALMVAAAS